jgi:hypothetical protein
MFVVGLVSYVMRKLLRHTCRCCLMYCAFHIELSSFHAPTALRTTHWDSLEKALTVFALPATPSKPRRVNRRLDLIFAPHEVYWTAVVGWYERLFTFIISLTSRCDRTGSIMFQRDLRRWAKNRSVFSYFISELSLTFCYRGLKFDSAGMRVASIQ